MILLYLHINSQLNSNKMTTSINYDLEKHLLNGCRIIEKDSVNYKTSEGDYTHILLECPKGYEFDKERNHNTSFICVEVFDGKWFDATMYFSTKSHARKSYYNNLTDDRISKININKSQSIK